MTDNIALSELEVAELLAFLVTAARALIDEPVDYGPLRLLQAAEQLCSVVKNRVNGETKELMVRLAAQIPQATARRNGQPRQYLAFLDEACRSIAEVLMRIRGVTRVDA
jgi:hypothetical protein